MSPMRIPPRTRRTTRTPVSNSVKTNTTVGTVLMSPMPPMPRPTGGDAIPVDPTKPASTSPMNRMNSPIPAVIAVFSWIGTASKTSLRRPVAASVTMMSPLMTTSPIASGQVSEPTKVVATKVLRPSPAANANGSRETTPNRMVMTPAASDVTAETCSNSSLCAGDVLDAGQDDRVQHDDVCHRDERDYAAAKFVGDRGPSCRDLEEPIEAIHSSTLGVSTTRVISCSARRNTRRSSAESTESQRSSPR